MKCISERGWFTISILVHYWVLLILVMWTTFLPISIALFLKKHLALSWVNQCLFSWCEAYLQNFNFRMPSLLRRQYLVIKFSLSSGSVSWGWRDVVLWFLLQLLTVLHQTVLLWTFTSLLVVTHSPTKCSIHSPAKSGISTSYQTHLTYWRRSETAGQAKNVVYGYALLHVHCN